MSDISKLFMFNPFAKFFKKVRVEKDELEDEEINDSQGVSQEEIELANFINYDFQSSPSSAITTIGIQFEQYFGSKRGRVQKYRQMARFPIINGAINNICDDAIVENPKGDIITLDLIEEVPEHIEDEIRKIWDYLTIEIFRFNERGWEFFRKWLIEAELYIEIILNEEGNDIIGIKILPSHTMMPIFADGKIKAFIQANVNSPEAVKGVDHANAGNVSYAKPTNYAEDSESDSIIFDKDQVAYANYGDWGESVLDVRGYLESAIRPFNQLNNMEDATVVNKLVRAPQRRIWNIYTGRMPKGKADEFVKQLSNRYKKKLIYDSETGAMNSAQNVQSLTEDFWFTKDINGNGTSVETIGGDNTFGEMDEVKYFEINLYKALMMPQSRWSEPSTSMFSTGKGGEIQREEISFARFIERLQRRFKYIILDPFITLLRLRGIDERYINHNIYNIQFVKSNLFKEYKEMELMESRLSVLGAVFQFVYNPTENPTGYFSPEYALKHVFQMSEEEFHWNKELLDKIKPTEEEVSNEEGGESGGGFGGEEFGGGEEMGGEEAGGEVPVAAPEEAPAESKSFLINDKDSIILNEWISYDSIIKNKHSKRK